MKVFIPVAHRRTGRRRLSDLLAAEIADARSTTDSMKQLAEMTSHPVRRFLFGKFRSDRRESVADCVNLAGKTS
jgi:hypothetical protein